MTRVAALGLSHDHIWSNLDELVATGRAELVGAADADAELREKYAASYPGELHDSAEALLDATRPDAVYVFSDNRTSAELSAMAARRGIHVLVEKPMAADLAGAESMRAAAESTGVRLMVNWPFTWWAPLRHGIAMAQAGELGTLWQVKYRAAHGGPVEEGCSRQFCEWLYDENRNGAGALMDYCCYGAVLADVLLGRPDQVAGTMLRTGLKPDLALEDNAILILTYPHAIATTEASWTQVGKIGSYTTMLYGSHGTVLVEPGPDGRVLHATPENPDGIAAVVPPQPHHLANASTHFLAAIEDPSLEIHPLCDTRHGVGAQWILEEGLKSARG